MATEAAEVPLETFRSLTPMNGLREDSLVQLHRRVTVEHARKGGKLFAAGSTEAASYYVISGRVDLVDDQGRKLRSVAADTPEARHRLAHQVPRGVSAVCATDVEFIRVDSNLLDVMLTWDQTGSYELGDVDEAGGDDDADDWMTRLLQMKAFQRVPPANLQAMFLRMEQVQAKAGDTIIRQGEDGDYFYVLTKGRCLVTRETPTSPKPIRLAEFDAGSCFGEEALISDAKRNATIRMLEDGTLMRLSKNDFQALLNAPLTRKLDFEQAERMVADGQAQWLDVRLPSEFRKDGLAGALNLPLYMLRMKLSALSKDQAYVVCCDSGRRSSVGVFVLTQQGYDAYLLEGGLPVPA